MSEQCGRWKQRLATSTIPTFRIANGRGLIIHRSQIYIRRGLNEMEASILPCHLRVLLQEATRHIIPRMALVGGEIEGMLLRSAYQRHSILVIPESIRPEARMKHVALLAMVVLALSSHSLAQKTASGDQVFIAVGG